MVMVSVHSHFNSPFHRSFSHIDSTSSAQPHGNPTRIYGNLVWDEYLAQNIGPGGGHTLLVNYAYGA